jgi:hypothetical protein
MMSYLRKSAGPVVLVGALLATPAEASTLPRVDFAAGDKIVAAGLLDVDFDYAITDRLSIGASMIPMPIPSGAWYAPVLSPFFAAIRSTFRAGEVLGAPVGVTDCYGVAQEFNSAGLGGSVNPFPGLPLLQHSYLPFLQPALDVAIPLGQDPDHWTLRATLGPIIAFDPSPRLAMPIWPNLEFSRPIGNHGELTLLGNGLVGWRGVF